MPLPADPAPERDEPFTGAGGSPPPGARSSAEVALGLQSRIDGMQASRLGSRNLPTVPALARILPGGGLQAGGSYSVRNSATLAMALLAGPSATGAWCGVVGIPDFGVEAAQGLGIDLERLVLVPDPGSQWLTVTAALVDVVPIVLTRAPEHLAPTEGERLRARLRRRGAALITLGTWKQSDSLLGVAESAWEGLGAGTGHLRSRRMKITATQPSGRLRHAYVEPADLRGSTGPGPTSSYTASGAGPRSGTTGPADALFGAHLVRSS